MTKSHNLSEDIPSHRPAPRARGKRGVAGVALALAAVLTLSAAVLGVAQRTPASASPLTVLATEDSYVSADEPNTNYGNSQSLRADGSPVVRSYIKFSVSNVPGSVTKATLKVFAKSSHSSGVSVYNTSTQWSEKAITYNNTPGRKAHYGQSGAVSGGQWLDVDVSSLVKGNGTYSFVFFGTSSTALSMSSIEGGATYAPRLLLEVDGAAEPAQPADPTPAAPAAPSVKPIRATFYYPWFPEAWNQKGFNPFTRFLPSDGFYDAGDAVIDRHIAAMQYGNIDAGISSWWGQGHRTDQRFPDLLRNAAGTGFRWALYYEQEGNSNPSETTIANDLRYIRDNYANHTNYLKVDGKFVVFVYGGPDDTCWMAQRWANANSGIGAYIVLKTYTGFRNCSYQPDSWHQYAPANAVSHISGYAYSISPGFWMKGENPRLHRSINRWYQNVRDMVASGEQWQLVQTFNEWGEGTSIESALEWASLSGYGAYLDALHTNGIQGSQDEQAAATATPTNTLEPEPTATEPPPTPASSPTPEPTSAPSGSATLLAVGDIADCDVKGDEAVAALLAQHSGTIAALGDNVYDSGTAEEYANCFDPAWGALKSRIKPAVGNHEYLTPNAQGYFDYFGAAAGDPDKGYYSYDLGTWHIIVLNSQCSKVGGCGPTSPQGKWLRADLAANANVCTLAYWHIPRFSSGEHGDEDAMEKLWQPLQDAGADVILTGHDHLYERFGRQTATGVADPEHGIRQFVVGTGGKNHRPFLTIAANSEFRNNTDFGILKMSLNPGDYSWQFINTSGQVLDQGAEDCVSAPAAVASVQASTFSGSAVLAVMADDDEDTTESMTCVGNAPVVDTAVLPREVTLKKAVKQVTERAKRGIGDKIRQISGSSCGNCCCVQTCSTITDAYATLMQTFAANPGSESEGVGRS